MTWSCKALECPRYLSGKCRVSADWRRNPLPCRSQCALAFTEHRASSPHHVHSLFITASPRPVHDQESRCITDDKICDAYIPILIWFGSLILWYHNTSKMLSWYTTSVYDLIPHNGWLEKTMYFFIVDIWYEASIFVFIVSHFLLGPKRCLINNYLNMHFLIFFFK